MQDSENPSPVRMKYLYGKYGKYFLLFHGLSFHLPDVLLSKKKFLIVMKFNLPIFFLFVTYTFGMSWKTLPNPKSQRCTLVS